MCGIVESARKANLQLMFAQITVFKFTMSGFVFTLTQIYVMLQ